MTGIRRSNRTRMTKISAQINYNHDLWLDYEIHMNSYQFNLGECVIDLGPSGQAVNADVILSDDVKRRLCKALAREEPSLPPHWQSVPPDLQRTVEKMASLLIDAANSFDNCLRQLPKATRLSPVNFELARTNGAQHFPFFYWHFDDKDKELLSPIFEELGKKAINGYKHGIQIPMPRHFDRMQVHLNTKDITDLKQFAQSPPETDPSKKLYGVALENFVQRSYAAAVLMVATSVETALKRFLINNGDEIATYLVANIQSPPIEKLYSCARKHAGMNLPKEFTIALQGLRSARNDTAHKSQSSVLKPLLVARWFAVGEAIVTYQVAQESDALVSKLVRAIGEKAEKNYPPTAKGVILRKEHRGDQDWYHIVMDTGEARRFRIDEFTVCKDQEIKN